MSHIFHDVCIIMFEVVKKIKIVGSSPTSPSETIINDSITSPLWPGVGIVIWVAGGILDQACLMVSGGEWPSW